jgi:hypothetical protein
MERRHQNLSPTLLLELHVLVSSKIKTCNIKLNPKKIKSFMQLQGPLNWKEENNFVLEL